jgi:hypothetical protein
MLAVVECIYSLLVMHRRLGQTHQIDHLLPHRPANNLIMYCPACPEHGVNMEKGYEKTPRHLRYFYIFFQ